MGSRISATAVVETPRPEVAGAIADALDICHVVEADCSRFLPESALARANAQPDRWHRVPQVCFSGVSAAWSAYRRTEGRFDPRVLDDPQVLGYYRWPTVPARPVVARDLRLAWQPRLSEETGRLHLGGWSVDLGGIEKGLALRWASQSLRFEAPNHLLEAGGESYSAGLAPDGGPWHVGVDDPTTNDDPVAVLALSDRACATTGIRLLPSRECGLDVHRVVDPATGLPGGAGLLSVTVVHGDPAWAHVWSKVLFLEGADGVAHVAERQGLAACWITDDHRLGVSGALAPMVTRRR
jgi:thiamine biosynthesis lipoprotein